MANSAKKISPTTTKENLKQDVSQKLETALESFKDTLGEKKFRKRIKKVSKNFLKGTLIKSKTKVDGIPKKKSSNFFHARAMHLPLSGPSLSSKKGIQYLWCDDQMILHVVLISANRN